MRTGTYTDKFLAEIKSCAGVIHKISALYSDIREDREDLFQEILYQCWKSYPNFRQESKFSTWVYKLSLNTALVHRSKSARSKKLFYSTDDLSKLPEARYDIQQADQSFMDLIKGLQKVERMIITLHLEGYSNSEISQITGLSKENTAVRIHRIRKALIEKLKEK
jgi:RNA polymerase sigma-70 factor (ECF subfamily)